MAALENSLLSPQQALLVSGIFNSFLFSVLTVQVYTHYLAFPKGSIILKVVITVIYFLQILEAVIVYFRNHVELVLARADPSANQASKLTWIEPLITAIVMSIVQIYYANCIRLVSKGSKLPLLILCCSILQLQAGITISVIVYGYIKSPSIDRLQSAIWHTTNAVCDVTIVVCMTYYLLRYFSHIRRTQRIVKRVVRLLIETGMVITIVTVACTFLLFLTFNHGNFSVVYTSVISTLYGNSLLALVNGRAVFRATPETSLAWQAPSQPPETQRDVDLELVNLEGNLTGFGETKSV
ncbi:hypothetical protein CPB83DRAFT_861996 [Crepidotus variabilis]|uniref:DUF6534 domain-containing protein n=1 Tax=Crepidotus variabilis TaxID=179855 RepID=A0A9P6JK70_9AGAR|nr:hypothetical protein CPB83DRAFT_861996 [Crepidotus variabilis]